MKFLKFFFTFYAYFTLKWLTLERNLNIRLIDKQTRRVREFSLRFLNGKSVYGLCHRIFMGHFRESTSQDLRTD